MTKELRPDTGDGRSLPCVRCGTTTPDASYRDGLPVCDNCADPAIGKGKGRSVKKSYWKARAKEAEAVERATRARAQVLDGKVRELTRELEDKRKNWAPIKIKHPYVPRDAGCRYCDDPAEDPRHG